MEKKYEITRRVNDVPDDEYDEHVPVVTHQNLTRGQAKACCRRLNETEGGLPHYFYQVEVQAER